MENGIQSDLIRGHVNTIILKALFEGDKYGYEICKEIAERSVGQYELKQPTLYSCLKRLEKQGWIKSYWGTTATGGGRRRYYTLSDLGRDMYLKSQAEWEYSRTLIDRLVSDKPYDLTTAPPPEINLKIVPVTKRKPKTDETLEAEDIADTEAEDEEDEVEQDAALTAPVEDEACEEEVSVDPPAPETEKAEGPKVIQYDLFDKLKVDVDKNIAEYEAVSKMYDETNVRVEREAIPEESVHTEEEPPSSPAYRIGFDRDNSEFLNVEQAAAAEQVPQEPERPTPPATRSYTEAILNDSAEKARDILFRPQPEPLVLKTFESDDDTAAPVEEAVEAVASELQEEQAEEEVYLPEERQESQAEKEYKNILNKLLSTAKSHSAVSADEVPEPIREEVAEKIEEEPALAAAATTGTSITTFEDKIVVETEDYSLMPHRQRGALDFSELQSKMQTEGFKIRAHAKDAEHAPNGFIFANKLMLATLCIVFGFVAVELLVIYFAANRFLHIPNSVYITLGSVACAMLLAAVIFCCANPNRKVRDRFQFGVSFGLSAILTVLAFVASFAVACLAASQLSITAELFKSVVLPTILALNMPIGVLVYAILRKSQKFQV